MGEVAKRVTSVVANTVGNTVGPVVSALMATAGIATVNPALAALAIPAGALAGSLTQEGVALVGAAINDRARRVGQFAEAAEEAAGRPIEDLMEQAADDDPLRTLLARTVEAASGSHDAWKIETLARAFVRGATDGAVVDEMLLLADFLTRVEVAHVRMLRVLWEPDWTSNEHNLEQLVRSMDAGIAGGHVLLLHQLKELKLVGSADPNDLAVRQRKTADKTVTALGRYLADALNRLGSMSSLREERVGGAHLSSPRTASG